MSLPKIIKISQTVWEVWPAQDNGFRGDKYKMKKVKLLLHTTSLLVPRSLTNIIKILKTFKLWSAQEFGLEIRSEKITRKRTKQELSLHVTLLHDLIYVPSQYFQVISNSIGVMACTIFQLQGT